MRRSIKRLIRQVRANHLAAVDRGVLGPNGVLEALRLITLAGAAAYHSRIETRARLLIHRLRWLESSERRIRHQLTELMGVDWEAGQP
jgi:hypothetical protein